MPTRLETNDRKYRALAAELAEIGFISPGSLVSRETSAASRAVAAGATRLSVTAPTTSGAAPSLTRPSAAG